MTIFQVIAVLFALFMIYVVTIHRKKRTLSLTELSFWTSIWIFFAVIAIFPHWLTGISTVLRFARIFDLLVVLALMVLSVVVFMSYFAQKEVARKLEQLVRAQAIFETLKTVKKRKKKLRKTTALRKTRKIRKTR